MSFLSIKIDTMKQNEKSAIIIIIIIIIITATNTSDVIPLNTYATFKAMLYSLWHSAGKLESESL
jgi:lysophospholipid acyltransferase (LPLAT)-like uncharacterized protein